MSTLATPETLAKPRHTSRARNGSWHPPVAPGAYAAHPAWRTRDQWLAAVAAALASADGQAVLRRIHIEASTALRIARADSLSADTLTGRGVATAHETVAGRTAVHKSTVRRARKVLETLGFEVVVMPGRYMTRQEREQAELHHGGRQIKFACVRSLVVPREWAHVEHEHLPRRGSVSSSSHVSEWLPKCERKRSHSGAAPRPKAATRRDGRGRTRPIEVQRLAARLAQRLPWLAQGHIGRLCDLLEDLGLDETTWSAQDILTALENDSTASGMFVPAARDQRNPLGLLRTRLQRAVVPLPSPVKRRQAEKTRRAQERAEWLAEREAAQARKAPKEAIRAARARLSEQLRAQREQRWNEGSAGPDLACDAAATARNNQTVARHLSSATPPPPPRRLQPGRRHRL